MTSLEDMQLRTEIRSIRKALENVSAALSLIAVVAGKLVIIQCPHSRTDGKGRCEFCGWLPEGLLQEVSASTIPFPEPKKDPATWIEMLSTNPSGQSLEVDEVGQALLDQYNQATLGDDGNQTLR